MQQMAIKIYVSNDFWYTFVNSINGFDCRLSGVVFETYKIEDPTWVFL